VPKDFSVEVRPLPAENALAARRPGGAWDPALLGSGVITVVDGKPQSLPTSYAGAVRIRAVKEPELMGGLIVRSTGEDELTLWLQLRAEPRIQLQSLLPGAVEKATDDQGQKLTPGVVGGGLPPALAAAVGGTAYCPVRLKRGEKDARALKELAGTVRVRVRTAPEAVITTGAITEAAGKTFKGKDGGYIQVIEVKEGDGKITVKFEMESPPNPIPAAPAPMRIRLIAPPPPPPPPPPAGAGFACQAAAAPAQAVEVQIQIAPAPRGAGAIVPFPGPVGEPEVTLVDDKGKVIAETAGGAAPGAGPAGQPVVRYTREYQLEKGQKAAKLVLTASRIVTIEVPFSFKDVPLR
jgi:hypothetical protein